MTASAVVAAHPSLAEDPEALAAAARAGHEPHRSRQSCSIVQRVVTRDRRGGHNRVQLTELLFQSGMNPNLAGWLGVTRAPSLCPGR